MEQLRIKKIDEAAFDLLVERAGGSRISAEDSADYRLNEAVIELKLLEEEGLEKEERRKKIASIFRANQPGVPTVVVEPRRLNAKEQRQYYKAVSGPIQHCIKKASSQLERTRKRIDESLIRVAIILNNGYTALSGEEFRNICIKCAHNDTSKIDWVIPGGIYFHSDGFDHWFLAGFEPIPINIPAPFPSFGRLQEEWFGFLNRALAPTQLSKAPDEGYMPVVDLVFELDGVRYVKEAGDTPESTFWPEGRAPRKNSTGLKKSPPVAVALPKLTECDWRLFKRRIHDHHWLKESFQEWTRMQFDDEAARTQPLKPFVWLPVTFDRFHKAVQESRFRWRSYDLCEMASVLFQDEFDPIVDSAIDESKVRILPVDYIYLTVTEVGNDEANDFCSISYVSNIPGFERTETLVKNERIFWEHGLFVAGAYAVKKGVNSVLYRRR